jgi:CRISPR-associated helicase Cas3/CRISPR-associated endonuclease Cas3-HD
LRRGKYRAGFAVGGGKPRKESVLRLSRADKEEKLTENFIAHTSDREDKQDESLEDHLKNTETYARRFGTEAFGDCGDKWGELAGRLHDVGKYQPGFQKYIRKQSRFKVDHAVCGAAEAKRFFDGASGDILAYCIVGHHSGLPDYGIESGGESNRGTLLERLNKSTEDFSEYLKFYDPSKNKPCGLPFKPDGGAERGFRLSLFVRMLYSCLTDADFLATEDYYGGKDRGFCCDFADMLRKTNAKTARLEEYAALRQGNPVVSKGRRSILRACAAAAEKRRGVYSLSAPTGGGKTLASLSFALGHLQKHGLSRIIYVIPYTSIIEQTAATLRELLGASAVLEHHSNYDFADKTDKFGEKNYGNDKNHGFENDGAYDKNRMRLASENWDAPIVVTTNVQFFESFFANKSSRSRKLHNVANSVILFDEAQMLPIEYLRPCMDLIGFLVKDYGCSALLMSATQPPFGKILSPEIGVIDEIIPSKEKSNREGFAERHETADGAAADKEELYAAFNRVRVNVIGSNTFEELIARIRPERRALVIVNGRADAVKLYELYTGENPDPVQDEGVYCLSALLTPFCRKRAIDEIRKRLEYKEKCIVFSTQLIECGVDVDFENVYRCYAGLDSLIQSAGRCNREGKEEYGNVFLFDLPDGKIPRSLDARKALTELIIGKYKENCFSLEAAQKYFSQLLLTLEELDKGKILKMFKIEGKKPRFDFKTCAETFKIIKEDTVSVIVPLSDEAKEPLRRAHDEKNREDFRQTQRERHESLRETFRRLQKYTVSLARYSVEKLLAVGAVREICDGAYELLGVGENYDPKMGLKIPDDDANVFLGV